VLKRDYRDLTGSFDKLVSIEMIEAVGRRYLPGYFEKCSQLLKDDGAMLIQAIVLPEQRYAGYEESVDFIQKYIFPGGFLPSISMMQQFVTQKTPLRMLALDDFGMHYAAHCGSGTNDSTNSSMQSEPSVSTNALFACGDITSATARPPSLNVPSDLCRCFGPSPAHHLEPPDPADGRH
jgi:hypothetical protein